VRLPLFPLQQAVLCANANLKESRTCDQPACPNSCPYSPWSAWSACSYVALCCLVRRRSRRHLRSTHSNPHLHADFHPCHTIVASLSLCFATCDA
jgi:hypothetical protein